MSTARRLTVFLVLAVVFAVLTVWVLYGFVMEQRGLYAPAA